MDLVELYYAVSGLGEFIYFNWLASYLLDKTERRHRFDSASSHFHPLVRLILLAGYLSGRVFAVEIVTIFYKDELTHAECYRGAFLALFYDARVLGAVLVATVAAAFALVILCACRRSIGQLRPPVAVRLPFRLLGVFLTLGGFMMYFAGSRAQRLGFAYSYTITCLSFHAFWSAKSAFVWGRQVTHWRDAESVMREDSRPPVLMLRSFFLDFASAYASHEAPLWKKALGYHWVSPEERLVASLERQFGPVVALGSPSDLAPVGGAARSYVATEWQQRVMGYAEKSQFAIVLFGSGEGMAWELRYLRANYSPRRLFILLVPGLGKVFWECKRKLLLDLGYTVPADAPDGGGLLLLDGAWRGIWTTDIALQGWDPPAFCAKIAERLRHAKDYGDESASLSS